MKIQSVEVFVYKYDHHYQVGGHRGTPNRISGTDYYLEPQWRHAYSRLTESCLIKITTDTGLIGWGEGQAPIVPEVPASLIHKLFGPAILGMDPRDPGAVYDKLYHLNFVRGHTTSYTIDAMAAIDIALWDLKGKAEGLPVGELFRRNCLQQFPLYVSGLRRKTLEERLDLAQDILEQGFRGIKIFKGVSVASVIDECEQLQKVLCENAGLAFDAICRYSNQEALELGEAFDRMQLMWFESPLEPEDIKGHSELVKSIRTPVAIGEPLRTVRQFEPWMQEKGMGIAQPDIVRCGITGGHRIISLAKQYNMDITFHIGVCTSIGVAASWHMASQMINPMIQEHQLELFYTANKILQEPLKVYKGNAVLPLGNGLGIQVDEKFVRSHSTDIFKIQ
ncbi:mandelate racemase/muconate lactonizing enzyme family protein [Gramella sp. AN32]|uniref:Mandelate racemase/muconate lactonizing enzyme family protein n=1 Tax=Christiangramia antarctica TaxID=2058158 RepID=A0ABW5X6W1_9FLAO|nr:mandelate racemase/muconate lactonizing enzyme family protein [Gramella sp. AN32]MCM4155759.1 enolase [Gramella sp. AN32]